MKKSKSLIISVVLILMASNITIAQDYLLTTNQIIEAESKTVSAFEKFKKKSKKKRLKKKYEERFNEAASKHQLNIKRYTKASQLEDKNWEGILNSMQTLQYFKVLSASAPTSNTVSIQDYTSKIDSVSALATEELYENGKTILEKNDNSYSYQIAYNYLVRAVTITPNYKNANELVDQAIQKDEKKVLFLPVTYDNLGNTVEFSFGSDDISSSSNYINTSLQNELKVNNVGSVFQKNRNLNTDWIVQLKWNSVDKSPEQFHKYTMDRSTTIKENGKEKTVTATVNYVERNYSYTGTLNCAIDDLKKNYSVFNQSFTGSTFFSSIRATYTGDKRALTNEDLNAINNINITDVFSNFEALEKIYQEDIQPQLLNAIGLLLNWNYEPYKE